MIRTTTKLSKMVSMTDLAKKKNARITDFTIQFNGFADPVNTADPRIYARILA